MSEMKAGLLELDPKAVLPDTTTLRPLRVSLRCKLMTRYAFLRQSVAYFAASAEEQLAHDMGADDAVNDIPFPLEDMFECGELTRAEIELIRPLEDLIKQYCSSPGLKPWSDEAALRADPSWAQIRSLAIHVLGRLPDECRENDASCRPSNDC